jgi:hypothetical protein
MVESKASSYKPRKGGLSTLPRLEIQVRKFQIQIEAMKNRI